MVPLSTVVDAVATAGVIAIAGLNVAIAAVAIRFFRLRLGTRWAVVVYSAIGIPVLYAITTLVGLGALGVGTGVTMDRGALLLLVWALPLAFGVSLEVFWMLPPTAYEDEQQETRGHGQ